MNNYLHNSLSEAANILKQKKGFALFLVYSFAVANSLFAQEMPAELNTVLSRIEGVFSSDILIIILTIALFVIGVALVVNKDNEKLKKHLIAWIIGVIILLAGSGIVKWLYAK
jgi:type IV secretory pathway VirB2 component (pilin)